jgi:hypothetical protein
VAVFLSPKCNFLLTIWYSHLMKLFGYTLKFQVTRPMVESYIRHLVTVTVGFILATAAAHHISFLNFTKDEWLEVANALWLSVIPSLRHILEKNSPEVAPLIETLLPAPTITATAPDTASTGSVAS